MKKYKLEDLFELQMGKTPSRNISDYWSEGVYDWISIKDLSNSEKYISETKEKLAKIAIEKSGIKPIPENTLVMSFKLSIGKVAITSTTMYSNEAIMAFRDKGVEDILTEYLYYHFLSKDWSDGSNKAVMGITLNKATLSNVEIKLHDIQEQERIVSILNKCDRLISLKKDELEELDTLIKSRFIEMFGDPEVNPYSWAHKPLNELGELGRGKSKHRPRNAPELLGGNYPLVQTGDIANSSLYITEYNSTYSELGLKQSKIWNAGTLCITIAANIAKTGILKFDACFPDSVVGFIPNNQTNNIFIHYWFSFFQESIEKHAPESAQKNINLRILEGLNVIVPDIDLQKQFSKFVDQVEKLKFSVQKSLDETQELFDSLMQEYFG